MPTQIDFGLGKPRRVRAVVAQLNCTSDDWSKVDGRHQLHNQELFDEQIAATLTSARRHTADLLLLPELGVPLGRIEKLREWSAETGAVVVAGSHYFDKGTKHVARAPIVVAGEVHFIEKHVPSPHEISAIDGRGISEGDQSTIFRNSPIGDFGVLICSDFLDSEQRRKLTTEQLDFLCVIAFQRRASVYHDRLSLEVEEAEQGIFALLANMNCPGAGDGKSSIFALMDRSFLQDFQDEGFTDCNPSNKVLEFSDEITSAAVEFDLAQKRPSLPRTVHSRPNVRLLSIESPQDETESRFSRAIAHDDDRYRMIDELFVPPDEFDEISANLESNKLVFITGDPGIGKTYTAAKLLRNYFDRGYQPVWFTGLEKEERKLQRQVLENFSPKHRQIIYFEDPFGRVAFERRDAIYTVFRPLHDRLKETDARIIVTSRRSVFETFSKESLSRHELDRFRSEMSLATPSYSTTKLRDLLTKLASINCKWWMKRDCRRIAQAAIEQSILQTPMAIRDFVMSSVDLANVQDLQTHISRRNEESARSFAYEINECTTPSRLTLMLVFLMGNRHQFAISAAFDRIAESTSNQELMATTFIQELREHLGHRVEQFGTRSRGFRFLHPIYEESLAVSVADDHEIKQLFRASAHWFVQADAMKLLLDGCLRQMSKYPTLCLELLEPLLQCAQASLGILSKINLASKLVGPIDKLGGKTLLNHFNKLAPLDELIDQINTSMKTVQIAKAIQLGVNSCRLNGVDEETLFGQINYNSLLKRIITSPRFRASIEILERLKSARPQLVEQFFDRISLVQLIRNLLYDPRVEDRIRFLSNEGKIDEATKRASQIAETGQGWHGWISEMLSETAVGGSIRIDGGAAEAIQKGYGLLPVGISSADGGFEAGDPVWILSENDERIAFGIAEYSATDLETIKGHHSSNILELCGRFNGNVAVRKSNLVPPTEITGAD